MVPLIAHAVTQEVSQLVVTGEIDDCGRNRHHPSNTNTLIENNLNTNYKCMSFQRLMFDLIHWFLKPCSQVNRPQKKVHYSELDTDVQTLTCYLYIYKVKGSFACTVSPAPLFGKQHDYCYFIFNVPFPCEAVLLMDNFNTLESSV